MNKGAWTEEEKKFVFENYHTMTIEDMADYLVKSYTAVQLYMHRNRLAIANVENSHIWAILKVKFIHPEYFSPTKEFYRTVKINPKRWWDICYGRKKCTTEEYLSVAIHFGLSLEEAFKTRQLTLFEQE